MAEQISTPAGFGGLMRYKEEYPSRFKLKPSHVIAFIIIVALFTLSLKFIL